MKKVVLSLVAVLVFSACKNEKTQTVVVAGDSWAMFVCLYKSMDQALDDAGVVTASANTETCALTTTNGMRASDWLDSKVHSRTAAVLTDPKVKVLYLSLGGNDLMNYWNKNMSAGEAQAALNGIALDIEKIIKTYRAQRPDIKILLTGYDFPHFTENHPIKTYREAYEDMGSPTSLELNTILVQLASTLVKIADNQNVFFIQHHGLMHYYYGNQDQGLAPKSTLSPDEISSRGDPNRIGGDIRLQSSPEAMLRIGPVVDPFHLSKAGFKKLADHSVKNYIADWLK